MSIYLRNLKFLKKHKYFEEKLNKNNFLNDVKIEACENQYNYIMENEESRCFVHSNYNINREMEQLFKYVDKDTDILIVFGFGCGYILDYIDSHFSGHKMEIFIIEPSLRLFKQVLNHRYIPNCLKNFKGNLNFLLDEDKLDVARTIFNKVIRMEDSKVAITYHISYRTIFKGYYEYIYERLVDSIRVETINYNCVDLTKKIWAINSLRSIPIKSAPIECLINGLQGYPAIIVAAGPSLNKNMHLLKEVKDKAIIIAIGSANKILDSNGIIPHLRVAIDPYKENDNIYADIDTSACPIIYDSYFYYNSLANYKGQKFRMIVDANHFMMHIYDKSSLKYKLIPAGFSVVVPTLYLLTRLKCTKIIFTGQDLSYPHKKMYAKGSWTDEEIDKEDKVNRHTKSIDIYGNEIDTIEEYLSIKLKIESIIQQNPHIKFINATQGGLNIKGTVVKDLKDVLKEDLIHNYRLREDIDRIYKDFEKNHYEEYNRKISNGMKEFEEEVDKVIELNDMIYEKLKGIFEDAESKSISYLLKNLEELEKSFDDFSEIPLFKLLISFQLHPSFRAIEKIHFYEGNDSVKMVESKKNITLYKCVAIYDYFDLLKGLLLENKQKMNVKGDIYV